MSSAKERKLAKNARKVRSAIDGLKDFYNSKYNSWDYGAFWGRVEDINQMFEDLRLKDSDREELWDDLGDYCDQVKEAMEKEDNRKDSNAEKIKSRIEGLSKHHSTIRDEWEYDDFWEEVEKINDMFSDMSLKEDDRKVLWSELQDYCERVKKRMNKDEREREKSSKHRRELVLDKLDKVYYMVKDAENVSEWRKAKTALYDIQEWMQSGWDAANIQTQFLMELMGYEGHFLEEDWRLCQDRWNEVKEQVDIQYEKICETNKIRFKNNYIKDIANEATYGDPYDALEKIKAAQKELHSGKAFKDVYFEEFKEKLDKYWKRASKRIDEKKRKKKQEWKSDMKAHIRRWKNTIEKQERFIKKKEREISELETELANAKSQEHERRVKNWIEKKKEKIREASNNISSMEDKIADVKSKIND